MFSVQVANNCTSFAIHNEFLLVTTHSHTCRSLSRLCNISGIRLFACWQFYCCLSYARGLVGGWL